MKKDYLKYVWYASCGYYIRAEYLPKIKRILTFS